MEVAERQGDEPDRKQNLLLLNKADLVSEEQRKIWANYFQKEGIEFIFFSAIEEQEKIEDEKEKVWARFDASPTFTFILTVWFDHPYCIVYFENFASPF